MRNTILLTLLFIIPLAAYCAPTVTKVEIQRGEKWWGVFVNDAPQEPFLKPFTTQTNQYSSNGSFTAPMLVSSDGRYIWSKHPMKIDFAADGITLTSDYESVTVQKGGKNLREAYLVCCHKNFPPSGKTPEMELFTKPVYETRNEFGYVHNQKSLMEYADRIVKEGLPRGTIVISDGWRAMNGMYDFDREYYHDPRRMVEELHEKGFKVMLTVTPFMSASGRNYISNLQNDYLIRKENGSPLIVETDGGYNACLDICRSETTDMIRQRLDFLKVTYGVDGFRFDARALLPFLDKWGKKDQFMSMWLELGKGTELCEYFPGTDAQMTTTVNCVRNNDCRGWESLTEDLNDIISAGLTGFPYCQIISSKADIEVLFEDDQLMARALQLTAFMPIMSVNFAPWRIKDAELLKQVKSAFALRTSLQPYIREAVEEAARTAEPLIRHMEYQFPRNGFSDCNDQFMLGSKYLIVAATDNASTKRIVRLPRGLWTDAQGRKFKGPLVTSVDISNGKIAYFELTTK